MNKIFLFVFTICISFTSVAQLVIQAHAGQDKSVCAGDSVQIGGNPISSFAAQPITITWTPNTNISNNTIAHPYVWPSSTTTYYLNITDANGRSAKDSMVVTLHIPELVTLDSIPHICLSDDPVVLNSGYPAGGWYSGKSISDSMTFFPNLAGFGNHELTYYFSDSLCSVLDSAKGIITVVRNPTIAPVLSSDTMCKGDSLWMKGSGGVFYEWKSTAPLSANSGDSVLTWPDSTSFYWIIGGDTAGCTDSMFYKITVLDCETGINQVQSDISNKIYPNPFSSEFFISIESNEISSIQIINIEGKIMLNKAIETRERLRINLDEAEAGIYLLKFLDEGGNILKTERIIKRSP